MSETLDVKLLSKEYRVACEPAERESLTAAVAFLADRLDEIATKTKGTGERLAIMAALNLAHEFLALKNISAVPATPLENESIRRIIKLTEKKIDDSLARYEKVR